MGNVFSENRNRPSTDNTDQLLKVEKQLMELQEENRTLSALYEDAIGKANAKTMEAEVAHLEFNQIFNAVGDPTWVINNRFEIVHINRAFSELLDLKETDTVLHRKCHELLPSVSCNKMACPVRRIRKTKKRVEIDEERSLPAGRKVPFLITAMPLFGFTSELVGVVVQFKDITERKRYEAALEEANQKLEQLASLDGLTQLANRRIFDERLHGEWMRAVRGKKSFSVILGDIDFFKKYNDHYGHQAGDECLKAVAGCIKRSVQRSGDLVARYGGEEFGILLPNTDARGAFRVAEDIREAVCEMKLEHARSDVSRWVTICLGVAAAVPSGQNGGERLLKAADEALYTSKNRGRNQTSTALMKQFRENAFEE